MVNAILVDHLFSSETEEEKYDINFYNEVAEMLRNDINEIVVILSHTTNIHNAIKTITSLMKLLRMIVPEKNLCLIACKKAMDTYLADSFDKKEYEKQMSIIRSFDVDEYLY